MRIRSPIAILIFAFAAVSAAEQNGLDQYAEFDQGDLSSEQNNTDWSIGIKDWHGANITHLIRDTTTDLLENITISSYERNELDEILDDDFKELLHIGNDVEDQIVDRSDNEVGITEDEGSSSSLETFGTESSENGGVRKGGWGKKKGWGKKGGKKGWGKGGKKKGKGQKGKKKGYGKKGNKKGKGKKKGHKGKQNGKKGHTKGKKKNKQEDHKKKVNKNEDKKDGHKKKSLITHHSQPNEEDEWKVKMDNNKGDRNEYKTETNVTMLLQQY